MVMGCGSVPGQHHGFKEQRSSISLVWYSLDIQLARHSFGVCFKSGEGAWFCCIRVIFPGPVARPEKKPELNRTGSVAVAFIFQAKNHL